MSEREITLSATDLRTVHTMMESMIDMLEGDPPPRPSPWETERSMLDWLNKRLSEAERTRFVRDLVVTRTWGEDCEYVEKRFPSASLSSIIKAWKEQVAAEFNEALPDGGETEGASIIAFHTGGDADVSLRSDSDMLWYAEFRVTLDFWYGDLGQSFTNDRDLIQHIFYDEGGVCGDFLLLSPTEEQIALEETQPSEGGAQ